MGNAQLLSIFKAPFCFFSPGVQLILFLSSDSHEGRRRRQKADAYLMCLGFLGGGLFVCKPATDNQQGYWFHLLQFCVVFKYWCQSVLAFWMNVKF